MDLILSFCHILAMITHMSRVNISTRVRGRAEKLWVLTPDFETYCSRVLASNICVLCFVM